MAIVNKLGCGALGPCLISVQLHFHYTSAHENGGARVSSLMQTHELRTVVTDCTRQRRGCRTPHFNVRANRNGGFLGETWARQQLTNAKILMSMVGAVGIEPTTSPV
jgi:hypothetical protein